MSRNFFLKGIASILFVSAILVSTANAQSGKRWIVKSGYTGTSTDTLASIKAAVNGAGQSDTVIVLDGTYKEKISFSKWASPGNRKLVLASAFLLDGDKNHIENTIISGAGITQNSQNDVLVASYGENRDSTYFKFIGFTVDSASKWALDIEGGLVDNVILKNSGSTGSIPFFFRGTKIRNVTVFNNIGVTIFGFQEVGSQGDNAPIWKLNLHYFIIIKLCLPIQKEIVEEGLGKRKI